AGQSNFAGRSLKGRISNKNLLYADWSVVFLFGKFEFYFIRKYSKYNAAITLSETVNVFG
ncbi:MAG: hypothetical protein ACK56I_12290, partial [bacterium]